MGKIVEILFFVFLGVWSVSGELAPISSIPPELTSYFHPQSQLESKLVPGGVRRERREVGGDTSFFEVSHYKLDEAGKSVWERCMMVRTQVKFEVRYRIRPTGVAKRIYTMPISPDKVNGTCAVETETSKMFIFWPGFNFSLVFTKNPEGNSYYMNRAVITYDRSHPALKQDFANAVRGGKTKLETLPDTNFFWTPLGKSYSCQEAEDQGPLQLFNVADDEIEGTLEFSSTRFQPFVIRAGGSWGPPVECLPRATRDVRDTMPFICSALVLLISAGTMAGYSIQRTFFSDSKINYGTYGDATAGSHEMEQVRGSDKTGNGNYADEDDTEMTSAAKNAPAAAAAPVGGGEKDSAAPVSASANPFKQKTANPFQNYGST